MKEWKNKNEILQRKYKTAQRSIQRSRQREQLKQTPRSKTDRVIKNLRLNKVQASKVRKQLLFSNVLSEEISRARSKSEETRDLYCIIWSEDKFLRNTNVFKWQAK